MKPIALVAVLMLSFGGAGEALAGDHGHGCGYYGCGGGGYYHARPYYPYNRGYYGYYGYPQHKNNNNSNSSVAYAIGGLALGAILMNAYNQNRAPAPSYYTQQQTYQAPPAAQGRHLVRDLNGNCYERTTDAAGNELRTELPPSACNW
jgi:hypothetical protein